MSMMRKATACACCLLLVVSMQRSYAQETIKSSGFGDGINISIPFWDTGISLPMRWRNWTESTYYPNLDTYNSAVELGFQYNHPVCLNIPEHVYCIRKKWNEFDFGVIAGEHHFPGVTIRPHEDSRLVEYWDRQENIRTGSEILERVINPDGGVSIGGSMNALGSETSIGGKFK